MSIDTSFEKKKRNDLTTKMKLYKTSEFISNDISFAPKSFKILLYYLNKNYLLFNRLIASLLLILNT